MRDDGATSTSDDALMNTHEMVLHRLVELITKVKSLHALSTRAHCNSIVHKYHTFHVTIHFSC